LTFTPIYLHVCLVLGQPSTRKTTSWPILCAFAEIVCRFLFSQSPSVSTFFGLSRLMDGKRNDTNRIATVDVFIKFYDLFAFWGYRPYTDWRFIEFWNVSACKLQFDRFTVRRLILHLLRSVGLFLWWFSCRELCFFAISFDGNRFN
jgi:hypothetical protein